MNILALQSAIAAVCPIVGVAVADPANKATWRIDFDPSATQQQQQAAAEVIASFDPAMLTATPPLPPTPRAWFERLAPATRLAIETAALSSAQLREWLDLAAGNPSIDVTSAETIAGVQALLAAGLITAAEQATLLAP